MRLKTINPAAKLADMVIMRVGVTLSRRAARMAPRTDPTAIIELRDAVEGAEPPSNTFAAYAVRMMGKLKPNVPMKNTKMMVTKMRGCPAT